MAIASFMLIFNSVSLKKSQYPYTLLVRVFSSVHLICCCCIPFTMGMDLFQKLFVKLFILFDACNNFFFSSLVTFALSERKNENK